MIINIPIEIDEDKFNEVIALDYERKVYNEIFKRVENAIIYRDSAYRKTLNGGLETLAVESIEKLIESNKDVIIEAASIKLAERLSKTKAAKDLLTKKE